MGSSWRYSTILRSSNTEINNYFGHSVALEGDTLVVGAIGEDSSSIGVDGDQENNVYRDSEMDNYSAGAAYVFERNESIRTQTAYLKPSYNRLPNLGFGHAVTVFEDTIAVAALDAPRVLDESIASAAHLNGESTDVFRTGNVFLYERGNNGWNLSLRIDAPASHWRFGLDIDLKAQQPLVLTQTRAFMYEKSASGWQLIWDENVGASVVSFNHEAMVFAMGNSKARIYTSRNSN